MIWVFHYYGAGVILGMHGVSLPHSIPPTGHACAKLEVVRPSSANAKQHTRKQQAVQTWVAVKELKLSYYIGETLLSTIYTNYGNLT